MEGQSKVVALKSGKKLEITMGAFSESKRLYLAVASELKTIKVDGADEFGANLIKDLLCTAIDSQKITDALEPLLRRCTYDGLRIKNTEETFEPVSAREDFNEVCAEVIKENVGPFTKNLSVLSVGIFEAVLKLQNAK